MRLRHLAALALFTVAAMVFSTNTAQAATALHFSKAFVNSPGADNGSNSSLNAEYVVVSNSSSTATYTLTGYTISDTSGHVYKFPAFNLRPGASVTVHTGTGANTSSHLYWGSKAYIWNNSGDTANLKTPTGGLKDSCNWGIVSASVNC